MLEKLITGAEKTRVLLLQDSCQAPGDSLLKSAICHLARRVDAIHLFLYEYPKQTFLQDVPASVIDRLTVHDVASDPLGWEKSGAITMDTDLYGYVTKLEDPNKKTAVVVDCLSNLILHRCAAYTCQVLNRAARKQATDSEGLEMVAMVHKGLHDNQVLRMLQHTATSVLDLGPPRDSLHHGACRSLHKKVSGKVLRQTEHYRIGPQYELTDVQEVSTFSESVNEADSGPDPTANLTFNLSLSETEKEARAKLVLPYMHKGDRSAAPSSTGSAKIFYQPDDADDFDEEDPDDDLNI